MSRFHLVGLVVVLPALFPVSVWAQRAGDSARVPTLVSSARGEVRATPDRATITLAVQTRAASATAAAAENAQRQTAVIAALRAAGVRDSQISTQDYAVTPETRFDKEGQAPRVVSYLVSNTIAVEVSASSRLGALIDTALAAGANQVSSVEFSASNVQQLYQKALAIAVQNARAQAQAMASAAGGRIGQVIDISTSGGLEPPAPRPFRGVAMAALETPVMVGRESVTASVTGRWEFIPK